MLGLSGRAVQYSHDASVQVDSIQASQESQNNASNPRTDGEFSWVE